MASRGRRSGRHLLADGGDTRLKRFTHLGSGQAEYRPAHRRDVGMLGGNLSSRFIAPFPNSKIGVPRPRVKRDITVPIGMSCICAISW